MATAIIGHTGFVGGSLAQASHFDLRIHRANLESLRGQTLERLVCAGLPAAKWIANREPQSDQANMQRLCDTLTTVTARQVVLISTIDVYPRTVDVDEDHDCGSQANHPYGTHRLAFEHFIRARFPTALIVRLPALFGPGLKKNAIFDLMHDNCLDAINPASQFQWYPLAHLPQALAACEQRGLRLVNLVSEPFATQDMIARFFPQAQVGAKAGSVVHYDVRTKHATALGGHGGYILTKSEVMQALSAYLASERQI